MDGNSGTEPQATTSPYKSHYAQKVKQMDNHWAEEERARLLRDKAAKEREAAKRDLEEAQRKMRELEAEQLALEQARELEEAQKARELEEAQRGELWRLASEHTKQLQLEEDRKKKQAEELAQLEEAQKKMQAEQLAMKRERELEEARRQMEAEQAAMEQAREREEAQRAELWKLASQQAKQDQTPAAGAEDVAQTARSLEPGGLTRNTSLGHVSAEREAEILQAQNLPPVPDGWEMKEFVDPATGQSKVVYVNHKLRAFSRKHPTIVDMSKRSPRKRTSQRMVVQSSSDVDVHDSESSQKEAQSNQAAASKIPEGNDLPVAEDSMQLSRHPEQRQTDAVESEMPEEGEVREVDSRAKDEQNQQLEVKAEKDATREAQKQQEREQLNSASSVQADLENVRRKLEAQDRAEVANRKAGYDVEGRGNHEARTTDASNRDARKPELATQSMAEAAANGGDSDEVDGNVAMLPLTAKQVASGDQVKGGAPSSAEPVAATRNSVAAAAEALKELDQEADKVSQTQKPEDQTDETRNRLAAAAAAHQELDQEAEKVSQTQKPEEQTDETRNALAAAAEALKKLDQEADKLAQQGTAEVPTSLSGASPVMTAGASPAMKAEDASKPRRKRPPVLKGRSKEGTPDVSGTTTPRNVSIQETPEGSAEGTPRRQRRRSSILSTIGESLMNIFGNRKSKEGTPKGGTMEDLKIEKAPSVASSRKKAAARNNCTRCLQTVQLVHKTARLLKEKPTDCRRCPEQDRKLKEVQTRLDELKSEIDQSWPQIPAAWNVLVSNWEDEDDKLKDFQPFSFPITMDEEWAAKVKEQEKKIKSILDQEVECEECPLLEQELLHKKALM